MIRYLSGRKYIHFYHIMYFSRYLFFVFFKKKRTPIAGYDIENGLIAWIRSNGFYADIL